MADRPKATAVRTPRPPQGRVRPRMPTTRGWYRCVYCRRLCPDRRALVGHVCPLRRPVEWMWRQAITRYARKQPPYGR